MKNSRIQSQVTAMHISTRLIVFWFSLWVLGQSLCVVVEGDIHYYDFVLKEKNYTRLCTSKSMLVVNDSFPGPEIHVHRGDTAFVTVHNQGYYGITIHWHGVKQPQNPWSDGPEYITQCPIEPGTNFTYEVKFSSEEGTLWWHAHSDWTRASVHGAIVILPNIGTTYPFPKPDEEKVIMLATWYVGDLWRLFNDAIFNGTDLPHSNAYTINGEPGDFGECSSETTHRWVVDYGKTYLLRIVNAQMNDEVFFAIAGHNMTVVGIDGAYTKPFVTSYLLISTGQAMDVLVTTNQSLGHYYMGGRQYVSEYPAVTGLDFFNVTAILQYSGNYTYPLYPEYPNNLPQFLDRTSAIEFTNSLKSLANSEYPISVPMNITTRMYIVISMNTLPCEVGKCGSGNPTKLGSTMSNISWVNPTMDILQAYYRNISGDYTSDFPNYPPLFYNFTADDNPTTLSSAEYGTRVKVLEYNEEVEIVFQGTDLISGSMNHPMHIHGYSFYVVGIGYGNYDNETDPEGFNFVDPPQVTTFSVPKNGWLAIRFKASNPGVWFWHCHLDRHMSWGMDTVFIVKNGGTPETSIHPPPAYMPPCNIELSSSPQMFDGQTFLE